MFDSKKNNFASKYLKKYSIILEIIWLFLLITIFLWDLQIYSINKVVNANIHANASINKDVLNHKWATFQSSIFTHSNPNLANIHESNILTNPIKKLS